MNTGFGFQPAIGIVALDQKCRAFDPRFFAVGDIHHLDFAFPALGPACVHAHQHAGPILALRAARAGMDFEIGIVLIGFAREQGLDLAACGFGLKGSDRLFGIGNDGRIAFRLAHLDQHNGVIKVGFETPDRRETIFKLGPLAHEFLRVLRIVPEFGAFDECVEFAQSACGGIDVKDASSAIQWIAWRLRRGFQFQRA